MKKVQVRCAIMYCHRKVLGLEQIEKENQGAAQ